MRSIKEKPLSKATKMLAKTARIPKALLRNGMAETAERFRSASEDTAEKRVSPENYATDKLEKSASSVVNRVRYHVGNTGMSIPKRIKSHEKANAGAGVKAPQIPTGQPPSTKNASPPPNAIQGGNAYANKGNASKQLSSQRNPPYESHNRNQHAYQGGKRNAEHTAQARRDVSRLRLRSAQPTGNSAAQPIKEIPKKTVKNARHNIKYAKKTAKKVNKTIKTAERTAKKSAKTAQKTTKAAAKLSEAAAKATVQAVKAVVKAAVYVAKAVVALAKSLISLIAAGGWLAVLVVIIIGAVACIMCSAFGLLYSNEADDGGSPMTDAIMRIETDFRSGIDLSIVQLIAENECDEVIVIYDGGIDGDSVSVNNWNDVLGIYSVMLTTDEENGTDVIMLTPEKEELLKTVFLEMNEVKYRTEAVITTPLETDEESTEDEAEEAYTTLYIYVDINSLSYCQAAPKYHFSASQSAILEEMMSPEYYELFAALLGVDVYGGSNLTEIISGLPLGTQGAEVVKAALSKLGCPYAWGSRGENSFDCSGLVYWSISQVNSPLASNLSSSAAYQAKWCQEKGYTVGRSELQPGDLIFWQNLSCGSPGDRWNEIHHTGIYIGDGKCVEASSSKGRVIVRDLWESASYPIYMFARPYSN